MNYENVLTSLVFMFVVIYIIYYSIYGLLKGKIPFLSDMFSKYDGYVNISMLFKSGLWSIFKLIVAVLVTGIIYHSFKTTHIHLSKYESNDDLIWIILFLLAFIIFELFLSWFKSMNNFTNQFSIYISLRKNTLGNNLRHAIANKDQLEIVKYHKLIKQTNEKVNLSIDEILTLMASLMKAGIYEDVNQILVPQLQQKHSLFQRYMKSNPEMAEYKVNGIDNSIEKSETFKYKLSIFHEKSQKIATLIMIAFIVQFVVILLNSMGVVSNVFKSLFIMLLSIVVIATLVIKYVKLKNIYQKEFNSEQNQINLKQAPLDRIQLGLTIVMFIIGVTSLIFI